MKKLMVLTLASAATFSQADILFTVSAGANVWNVKTTGTVDGQDLDESGFNIEKKNKMNVFAAFEHPLPFIPNIKVANTNLDLTGKGSETITFQGETFTGDTETSVDLSHTDLTLYWGVPLPLPYIDINFGLTGRSFHGGAEVTGTVNNNSMVKKEDFSVVLPMLFGQVKVDSPFGFYGYADINYIGYSDNRISDMTFAAGYTLPIPVVDLNIEAGHRQLHVKGDINDFESDIKIGGIFAGINLAFGF